MNTPLIVDSNCEWMRSPRSGRRFDFELGCQEVLDVITSRLPDEYLPYELLLLDAKPLDDGSWTASVVHYGLSDFCKIAERENVRIYSKSITLPYPFETLKDPERAWNLSGFICVQLHMFDNPPLPKTSSITITDKIENKKTGEIVTHSEYFRVYSSIVRGLRNAEKKTALNN